MSKQKHTGAGRLPALDPVFTQALKAIAESEGWTTEDLLNEINREKGPTLAARARTFALNFYRDSTSSLPSGFAEEPGPAFETAINTVRTMNRKR